MAERGKALIAALLLAWTAGAHAQALEVQGDRCFDERSVRAALARYTRMPAHELEASALRARVVSEGEAVSLRVLRGDALIAERRFDWSEHGAETGCEARLQALAIALALALENAQQESQEQGTTARTTPAAAARAAAPPAAPRSEPEAAPEAKAAEASRGGAQPAIEADDAPQHDETGAGWPLRIELAGGALIGVLPAPAAFAALGAELEIAPFLALSLAALGTLQAETAHYDGSVGGQLFGGRAGACAVAPTLGLRGSACLAVALGVVRAGGSGFSIRDAQADLGWSALLAGVALDFPIFGPFSLRAAAHACLSLLRPELRVVGTGVAHTTAPVGLAASIAFLWALR